MLKRGVIVITGAGGGLGSALAHAAVRRLWNNWLFWEEAMSFVHDYQKQFGFRQSVV